uniref:nuclear mitotic apparatus protein 1 isoform X2 n=1 Tax=Monopterus albus TaxID=43700 RepID=UPI0009B3DD0A|nr:nuclear mitotic apparatus protein 1 isoform X2 [Monopterus albus]
MNNAINLGVKALLVWVNSLKILDHEVTISDLQDGTVLLKVVYMLKKENNPCFSTCTEERFRLIAKFLERDCRFRPDRGTKLSWENIREGINLAVEIAKVLLLLVYHDIMNDRSTLNTLECAVEQEIANLTGNFVLESEGFVSLSNGLEAYLRRKHLPISCEIFEQSATTSSSSASTTSSLSEDESPFFCRTSKVTFVGMQAVASSSVSKSPLQEIMNTPKFQMRKMQRQMMKERDYRDGLERELASKLAALAQRESCITQLQYHLDKLKEEHSDQEQLTKQQIDQLETKNSMLQMRFNEVLKQNKDFKSTSSLMERKVDELTDENGVLSSQLRAVRSQLATFEAEVVQLTENQVSAEEEWRSKTANLQYELSQATALKELLTEQIQILQGKISCLEDEIKKSTTEEVGENMGLVMEIQDLKFQLEQVEQQKHEQVTRLQQHITACEKEIETLKEVKKEKEDLLQQTEEKVKDLETKLLAACSAVADKDQHINRLREEVDILTDETKKHKDEIQAKEEMLATLLLQKSNEQEILNNKIQILTVQVEDLNLSLKQAEQEIQLKQDLLAKIQQENILRREQLQQQIVTYEEQVKTLSAEMQIKNEHLINLKNDSSRHTESLQQEIKDLKDHIESLNNCFKKAEETVQAQQVMLTKQEQEGAHQAELLQQLSASEEMIRILKEEIQTKEQQINMLKNQSSEQAELLLQEIHELKKQIKCLGTSLQSAEENLQSKENLFAQQQLQSSQHMEVLQAQMETLQDEVKRQEAEVHAKEEQLVQLKTETSTHSETLETEIEDLNKQIKSMCNSLEISQQQVQAKEDLMAKQEQESTLQIEELKKHSSALEGEVSQLKEVIQSKEEKMNLLKSQSSEQAELLLHDIHELKKQVECLGTSLQSAEENLQSKENLLAKQQLQSSQHMVVLQAQMEALQNEVKRQKAEVHAKEEQLVQLKTETSTHCEALQQEIEGLNEKIKSMSNSLVISQEQVQVKGDRMAKLEQESALQIEALKKHCTALEREVNQLKEEIQSKEEQMNLLKNQSSEQAELLIEEIQKLKKLYECLGTSLQSAEENLQSKENLFAQQQLQSSQHMEVLQAQMETLQDEVKRQKTEIHAKEEQLVQLKNETSTHSEALEKEIEGLNQQIKSMCNSLEISQQQVQAKEDLMAKQEQESALQIEELKKHSSALEGEVDQLKEEIQAKERKIEILKVESWKESEVLHHEIQTLRGQVQSLSESLKTATEQIQAKENLLAQKELEISKEKDSFQSMTTTSEAEIRGLKEQLQAKEEQLVTQKTEEAKHSDMLQQEIKCLKQQLDNMVECHTKAEEQVQAQQNMFNKQEQETVHQKELLHQQLSASVEEVRKLQEEIQVREEEMILLKTDNTKHSDLLNQEIQCLKQQVESLVSSLKKAEEEMQSKEVLLAQQQQENTHQMEALQSLQEEVKQVEILQKQIYSHEEMFQKLKESQLEKESLLLKAEQQLQSVNAELTQYKDAAVLKLQGVVQELHVASLREKEVLVQEKDVLMARILQAEEDHKALEKQVETVVLEKERLTEAKQALEREKTAFCELESALQQKLLKEREKVEKNEMLKRDLQEQLSAKSEAVEHYKAQMEKAVSHYNDKKLLLQKSQEEAAKLKHSLEVQECKLKTVNSEKEQLQLDLDNAQTSEKNLLKVVASLEAQLAFADHNLRAQNKIDNHGRRAESLYLTVPCAQSDTDTGALVKRSMSSDSLEHSSLEDSLNAARKFSASDKSSTPCVRSSERLAAKRKGLRTESLETLYFTPIKTKKIGRNGTEHNMEMDSGWDNPASSVKRRRTTQVINITMTKRTPGFSESDETFYSLNSARSHQSISRACPSRRTSPERLDTTAIATGVASNQLTGLPGYRRSTVHSQTTSTFCVGTENEPEVTPEDWMRIAELQARNQACLPHLKSSYPVESETGCSSRLVFTDEDLRTGNPSETIRRASMMPRQIEDSLVSHRHSLMLGQTGFAGTLSNNLSSMPTQQRSMKGTKQSSSVLSAHHSSPEKKVKVNSFSRPLTPKNKNLNSGPLPAERRQSMVFTIDNTPKNSRLKKGLNKLRSSSRKSPGKSLKGCQENVPSGNSRAALSQAVRAAKSPGLTASARKV